MKSAAWYRARDRAVASSREVASARAVAEGARERMDPYFREWSDACARVREAEALVEASVPVVAAPCEAALVALSDVEWRRSFASAVGNAWYMVCNVLPPALPVRFDSGVVVRTVGSVGPDVFVAADGSLTVTPRRDVFGIELARDGVRMKAASPEWVIEVYVRGVGRVKHPWRVRRLGYPWNQGASLTGALEVPLTDALEVLMDRWVS